MNNEQKRLVQDVYERLKKYELRYSDYYEAMDYSDYDDSIEETIVQSVAGYYYDNLNSYAGFQSMIGHYTEDLNEYNYTGRFQDRYQKNALVDLINSLSHLRMELFGR